MSTPPMPDRESAARRFAELKGWTFVHRSEEYAEGEEPGYFGQFEWEASPDEIAASEDGDEIETLGVPPADVPLHEQFAFAARIIEASGPALDPLGLRAWFWDVTQTMIERGTDMSHAALLVGIVRLEARHDAR